jgi:pyrimidine operon attenuation protein/uracil phosphoribosyltransferase
VATSWEEIQLVIEELQERKILLNIHGRFLSLAVRSTQSTKVKISDLPCGHLDITSYRSQKAASEINNAAILSRN